MIIGWSSLNNAASYANPLSTYFNATELFARFWTPVSVDLYDGTIKLNSAPGGGNSRSFRCLDGGVQTGSIVTVSDPDTSVRSAITGTWPASTSEADGQGKTLHHSLVGTPPFEICNNSIVYQNNDIDPGIGLYSGGSPNAAFDTATTTYIYTTFFKGGTGVASTTEANWQIPWPTTGKFKRVFILYKSAASALPQSIIFTLRIDGVDTAMTYTLPSLLTTNSQCYTESTLEAEITSAGQLVSFGYKKTNAAQTASFTAVYCFGFIAD